MEEHVIALLPLLTVTVPVDTQGPTVRTEVEYMHTQCMPLYRMISPYIKLNYCVLYYVCFTLHFYMQWPEPVALAVKMVEHASVAHTTLTAPVLMDTQDLTVNTIVRKHNHELNECIQH